MLASTRHTALSSSPTEVFVRAQLRGADPMVAAEYTRTHAGMMITKDDKDHYRLRVPVNFASIDRGRRGTRSDPRLPFLSNCKPPLLNHLTLPISPLV